MPVVRQRLDHIRTPAHELPVEGGHGIGKIQHHFGHKRTGLHIATPFQFKEIAFGAEHRMLM